MKFKINEREWKIVEINQEEMRKRVKEYDGKVDDGQYFGLTLIKYQMIYIAKDLCEDQKRQTLLHELMHCYLETYLFSIETLNVENLCDISACSHDVIHKIVEEYFRKNRNK